MDSQSSSTAGPRTSDVTHRHVALDLRTQKRHDHSQIEGLYPLGDENLETKHRHGKQTHHTFERMSFQETRKLDSISVTGAGSASALPLS